MATLSVIDAASAPKKIAPGAGASVRRKAEYDAYVKAVKTSQVGKLTPQGAETTRSLAMRVARAGTRTSKAVESWAFDGVLYFKVS